MGFGQASPREAWNLPLRACRASDPAGAGSQHQLLLTGRGPRSAWVSVLVGLDAVDDLLNQVGNVGDTSAFRQVATAAVSWLSASFCRSSAAAVVG